MGEKTGQKLEGYPLKELKSAETLWRGLYGIEFEDAIYVIEVDFFDFSEKVRLYRDGFLVDEGVSPVVFDLGSGVRIEAAMALFGMKYARMVGPQGTRLLTPLPGTAEAKRTLFEQNYPDVSKAIAASSWLVLVVALITQIPNLINGLLGAITMLGFSFGTPLPTFPLPPWANTLLSVLGLVAGLDRGLRMVHNPLLDD